MMKIAIWIAGLQVISSTLTGYSRPQAPSSSSPPSSVFVHSAWALEKSLPRDFKRIRDLAKHLEEMGILRLFVRAGRFRSPSSFVSSDLAMLRQFQKFIQNWNSDFQVVPWIGLNTRKAPLKSRNFPLYLKEIAGVLRVTSQSEIHLDVEPLFPVDESINFFSYLRQHLHGVKIGVAAPKLLLKEFPVSEEVRKDFWDVNELERLCFVVDELVVMYYDTGFYKISDYIKYLRQSLVKLSAVAAQGGCSVTAGIPAYYQPTVKHNPAVENVKNALKGVLEAFSEPSFFTPSFVGVAVYSLSHIDKTEAEELSKFTANIRYR